jgi:hypothetical protein
MALEDTPSIISYAGNDSTVTAYPLPFVFFSDDDIALYVDGVLSADTFSIIGDKFAGTASAVTDVAYTSSPEQTVTFQREVSYDQPTVLPGSGRTDPTTLERAYDYLSMQIQQVAREVEESPKAAPGDTTPGGSFSEAANTTVGQDANGDLVMRSAAEEVAFLGIGTSVDAAVASAAAALVSETNAATSETNAAASEANAAASEAAALDALDAIPASLSASNTFTIATNAAVGSILLTFDGGGVFWAGPGDQDEAAQGLADLINAGVHPVTATATGNILRVVAKLPGDDGNGISCVVVMGGGFGSWAGPETTGGSISNLVLTSPQSFTSTQKAQARENIGLDQIDNTSDADKPVSTAQAAARKKQMWAKARAAGMRVTVMTQPMHDFGTGGIVEVEQRQSRLNALTMSDSSLYDYLVPLHIILPDDTVYPATPVTDTLHFNDAGNVVIADAVARVLGPNERQVNVPESGFTLSAFTENATYASLVQASVMPDPVNLALVETSIASGGSIIDDGGSPRLKTTAASGSQSAIGALWPILNSSINLDWTDTTRYRGAFCEFYRRGFETDQLFSIWIGSNNLTDNNDATIGMEMRRNGSDYELRAVAKPSR